MAIYTTRSRRFRAGAYSLMLCAAAAVLVILVNLIVGALPKHLTQIDTSTAGYYDISEASEAYLAALEEDVSLYLIAETNAEDTVVSTLLSRIEASSEHVRLRQIDPALFPAFTAQYTDETLAPNAVIVASERRSAVVNYRDLFYETARVVGQNETLDPNGVYQRDENGRILEVTKHYAGESRILSAIDYTVSAYVPKVCSVTGHGETQLEGAYLTRLDLENIKPAAQAVQLLTSTAIPEDCSLLLILYPTSDFSSVEIGFLRSYLNRGGKILLETAYSTELPNLFALLGEYGMQYQNGIVLESSAVNYLQYPFYVMPSKDRSLENTPVMVACHAITLSETASVTLTPLYAASESAYLKDPAALQTTPEKGTDDPLGPFLLGVLSENSGNGSAICWISARFFAHSNCDALTNGANLNAFVELAGRLTARETRIPVSEKTLDGGVLAVGSAAVGNLWGIILIGILPLGTMAAGFAIWARRRKR